MTTISERKLIRLSKAINEAMLEVSQSLSHLPQTRSTILAAQHFDTGMLWLRHAVENTPTDQPDPELDATEAGPQDRDSDYQG